MIDGETLFSIVNLFTYVKWRIFLFVYFIEVPRLLDYLVVSISTLLYDVTIFITSVFLLQDQCN